MSEALGYDLALSLWQLSGGLGLRVHVLIDASFCMSSYMENSGPPYS